VRRHAEQCLVISYFIIISDTKILILFFLSLLIGDEGKRLFIDTHGIVHMNEKNMLFISR
jgi:hypothetical protein